MTDNTNWSDVFGIDPTFSGSDNTEREALREQIAQAIWPTEPASVLGGAK